MKPDPIVAEVREARESVARRYGNDPDKIYFPTISWLGVMGA